MSMERVLAVFVGVQISLIMAVTLAWLIASPNIPRAAPFEVHVYSHGGRETPHVGKADSGISIEGTTLSAHERPDGPSERLVRELLDAFLARRPPASARMPTGDMNDIIVEYPQPLDMSALVRRIWTRDSTENRSDYRSLQSIANRTAENLSVPWEVRQLLEELRNLRSSCGLQDVLASPVLLEPLVVALGNLQGLMEELQGTRGGFADGTMESLTPMLDALAMAENIVLHLEDGILGETSQDGIFGGFGGDSALSGRRRIALLFLLLMRNNRGTWGADTDYGPGEALAVDSPVVETAWDMMEP